MSTSDRLKEIRKLYQGNKPAKRTYDPKKQSEGYKKRLEGSGIDVDKALDKRSLLEKAFNLPDDQNPIFDIFEIINRPQQAIFGAIENSQSGEDAWKGALEGIKGNKKTQFKEILQNAGMEATDGKLGMDDVLGFAGDVFLDPVDWAILPVSGVSNAAKLKKATDALADASKVYDAAKTAGDASALFNAGMTLKRAKKGLTKAQRFQKITRRSPLGAFASTVGSGFGGSFRLADSGINKMLGWLDEVHSSNLVALGKPELVNDLKLVTHYSNIKQMARKTFNIAAHLPDNLIGQSKLVRGSQRIAERAGLTRFNKYNREIKPLLEELSRKTGMSTEDVESFLGILYENGNSVVKNGRVVRSGMKKTSSFKAIFDDEAFLTNQAVTKETADAVENFIKEYMPKWYADNVENTTNTLFRKYDAHDGIVETYRINSKEMKESLKTEFGKLTGEQNLNKVVKRTIEGADVDPEEVNSLKVRKTRLEKAKADGSTEYLPEGTKEYKKHVDNTNKIKKIDEDLKFNMEIAQKNSVKKKPDAKVAEDSAKSISNLLKAKEELVEANRLIMNANKVNIDKELAKITERLDAIKAGTILGSDVLEIAKSGFEMPTYFDDNMLNKLEKFVEHDEAIKALDKMHEFMSSSIEDLRKIMGAVFNETDGYLAHALTPEWAEMNINRLTKKESFASTNGLIGNSLAFASRRYKTSAFEANRLASDYVQWLIDNGVEGAQALTDKKMLKMFAEDVNTSFVDFLQKGAKSVGDAQMLAQVLGHSMLAEQTGYFVIREAKSKPPWGYTQVSAASLKNKMDSMKKFVGKEEANKLIEATNKYLEAHANDLIYIDNNIDAMIGRLTEPKAQNEFLMFIDFFTNIFKRNKLLSPGFQLRNIFGNSFNMWLSGMPMKDIANYTKKADDIIKQGSKLFDDVYDTGRVLTPDEQVIYDLYTEFVSNGFDEVANLLHDIPESLWNRDMVVNSYTANKNVAERVTKKADDIAADLKKDIDAVKEQIAKKKALRDNLINKNSKQGKRIGRYQDEMSKLDDEIKVLENDIVKLRENAAKQIKKGKAIGAVGAPKHFYDELGRYNMNKNKEWDVRFRLAMMMYAKENPQFLEKLGAFDAADAVRRVLFDFQDLSVTEKEVMRKIMPFYTFTKKNLAFQMRNLFENPVKYNQAIKSINSLWGTLDLTEEELDRFKVENFWLPIPFVGEDGKYRAIKSSLPFGDLGEFLDRPFQRALSATAPIVRAPFEIATNTQIFSGMPIQEFKGQKGFYIPEFSRKTEFGLSQMGLDVPLSQAFDVGRATGQLFKGEIDNPFEYAEKAALRTVTSIGDKNATAQREAYNELDDLENLMRYYKQEGIEIKMLAEINNPEKFDGNRAIIERLKQIRAINQR